jgi:two-component system, LytTR family, response regulator
MYPINNTIMIPYAKGLAVVDISSIVRIEAVSNYSRIFLSDGRQFLVSKVLKQMEAMLAEKGFARVHRSHLVNTAYIQAYNLRRLHIRLRNNEEVAISRRKRRDIRKKFSEQAATFLNKQKINVAA